MASEGYLDGQLVEILTVALHREMRHGEIMGLKWSDIDLLRKVITVTKTKNKDPKTIPMNETVYKIVFKKREVISLSGYVFAQVMARRLAQETCSASSIKPSRRLVLLILDSTISGIPLLPD